MALSQPGRLLLMLDAPVGHSLCQPASQRPATGDIRYASGLFFYVTRARSSRLNDPTMRHVAHLDGSHSAGSGRMGDQRIARPSSGDV
jgi:hypothetical protein